MSQYIQLLKELHDYVNDINNIFDYKKLLTWNAFKIISNMVDFLPTYSLKKNNAQVSI